MQISDSDHCFSTKWAANKRVNLDIISWSCSWLESDIWLLIALLFIDEMSFCIENSLSTCPSIEMSYKIQFAQVFCLMISKQLRSKLSSACNLKSYIQQRQLLTFADYHKERVFIMGDTFIDSNLPHEIAFTLHDVLSTNFNGICFILKTVPYCQPLSYTKVTFLGVKWTHEMSFSSRVYRRG